MIDKQVENLIVFKDQNERKIAFISVKNTIFIAVGKPIDFDQMSGLTRDDLNALCLWLNAKLRGEE